MPKVFRRAAGAGSLPVRVFVCCFAVAVGVLVLQSGTARAKPRKHAKRHHHVVRHRHHARRSHHARRHRLRHRHRVRRHHRHARRHAVRARRLRRLRIEHRIVLTARRALGVRYRWGGGSPRTGFDCSGLAMWVYRHVGVSLPHYTVAQWRYGARVPRRALAPGDLMFFSGLGHVGIYVGHGAVIHAPRAGARVRVESLSGWLGSSYEGARRLVLTG
jgi:cell wall-associated NlpC family hydrolase